MTEDTPAVNVEGKTQAQFASCEVAYLLALGCAVGETTYAGDTWTQNPDHVEDLDPFPVFGHGKVYKVVACDGVGEAYSNGENVKFDNYNSTANDIADPVVYNQGASLYAFAFDGLLAAELRQPVSVAVFSGNTRLSSMLTYSASTYGNGKTGPLLTLCKHLMAYSDSARAYFQN